MTRDWSGKRYWIVGASEGLGREVARILSRSGADLVLSARNEARLRDLAADLPRTARVAPCDVSDGGSVRRAAEEAGEIDGVCYIAGVYWPHATQNWNAEEIEQMLDINLLGAARVMAEVVPAMVARGFGHIVLTGSLSGYRGLPNSVGYGASKAGLMGLAEAMHADLRGSGVDVQLVNPGFVRTRLTEKNAFRMPQIMEPEAAARVFVEHMGNDAFARSFPLGLSTAIRVANFLPDALYYRLFG